MGLKLALISLGLVATSGCTTHYLVNDPVDEIITEDEWAMLESLRNLFGIQPDQHALIEEAIRSMSESDGNGERRLERLERFNTVCPYV